jgi:PAS domain S-box-containing protein
VSRSLTRPLPPVETGLDASAELAVRRLAERAFDLVVVVEFPSLRPLHVTGEIHRERFAPEEFLQSLREEIGPVALSGRAWKGDATVHTATGGSILVRAFVSGLPASAGFPDRLVIGAIHASAELRTDQMLLRALLEHLPDSIYFKDRESRFIRASDALARRQLQDSADALVGKTDFDLYTEEHARPAFDDEQRIIATGQPILGLEEKETWEDGRVSWVDTCKLPLRDARGQIIGTFGISRDITARKNAEENLRSTQKELLAASRLAGMAEIASGVLHNVGNALNSITTSVAMMNDSLASSQVAVLARLAEVLKETDDLGAFVATDPRGKQLPRFLAQLAEVLAGERQALKKELLDLRLSVDHMVEVVAVQQRYARGSGVVDECQPAELVEAALHISAVSLAHHGITVVRDFRPVPALMVERHKVLQILVNLIRNAKDAMDESGQGEKPLTISVDAAGDGRVRIVVRDEGVGIAPENLSRIFQFGFTTRAKGHGFGLHSSANTAAEIGGKLFAHSEGRGKGAAFTLELPLARAPRLATSSA